MAVGAGIAGLRAATDLSSVGLVPVIAKDTGDGAYAALPCRIRPGAALALLLLAIPLEHVSPLAAFWTVPCILVASLLIAWGAESAQFFVAQGFALAILAWMQTLPEFAVEAVLAWKQQTDLLLANLTGALRLLTGVAWPMIYVTAAVIHRRGTGQPLGEIKLEPHHSVEVAALCLPLLYALLIWWKGNVQVYDAAILIVMYAAYLWMLTKLPPQEREEIEELEKVPRSIVLAPRGWRIAAIAGCFLIGGGLIYFTAEPFLGSLIALAVAFGIPSFVVIQWLAPIVSEFPELASTFYFARQPSKSAVALMNIVSSNVNQWTLLFAMLPIVYSLGHGSLVPIPFDEEQRVELILTISQSIVGLTFLFNMRFAWWEASALLVLFILQFVLPHFFGLEAKIWISWAFLIWALFEIGRLVLRRQRPPALVHFVQTWRKHI